MEGDELRIRLPYNYEPREYQVPFLHAMETEGKKRAVCVWHRRAGKDKTFLNFLIPRMLERIGAYYYYFPTASMGRDILWQGMDRASMKFTDHFPTELIARKNDTEMMIELKNGSIFKIRGTDKREPIGVNPLGCVFSEYSRQNPHGGWDLVRPILAENQGWAVFNFTPRGKNHAYRLWRMAAENPDWYCQTLSVNDTHAISYEAIEDDRLSGMSEELIQQEYYCSFDIGAEGSYYGRSMTKLWASGQVGNVPHIVEAPVYTAWDVGIGDCTAIWFFQVIQKVILVIDYYETYGEGMSHYAKVLRDKPYRYSQHFFPPDVNKRQFQEDGSIKSVLQVAQSLLQNVDPETGSIFGKVSVIAPHSREAGIEHTRIMLQADRKIWFDKVNCEKGIDCLENYHKVYKDKQETYSDEPDHDWSSHGADAFRYLVVGYKFHLKVQGERIGLYEPAIPGSITAPSVWGDDKSLLDFGRVKAAY